MSKTVRIAGLTPGFPTLAMAMIVLAVVLGWAQAASAARENLADLVAQSELILLADVDQVSDGVTEQRVPFTEVTLNVIESLKGAARGSYRFRQFGLQEMQHAEGGPDRLAMSPQGFPRWASGETVLVFLQQPARHTGLRTTVGLTRGKLIEVGGQFESRNGVAGLFEDLVVEADGLTRDQIDMLNSSERAVDSAALLALLRRAVAENWVENGVMHHTQRSHSANAMAPHL